jgi:hypothetical protein
LPQCAAKHAHKLRADFAFIRRCHICQFIHTGSRCQ